MQHQQKGNEQQIGINMDINVDDHENHDSYQNNHSSTNRRKELTINSNDCINQVCAWYELFMSGKLPHRRAYHVSFYWNDHFYVHGGQDLKEGAYGDLWRVDYQFIFNETQLINDNQIQNIEWEEIQLSGVYPKKLSHHAGILQPALQSYIIYGGIVGADSSDVLYVINLNNFNVQAIPSNQQTEKNGKSLPGPRDDFCFVTAQGNSSHNQINSLYVIGGYKNGQKMNDIFKLHILDRGRQFVWELLEIQGKSCPQPRSGFSGVCLHDSQGNEEVYIIGGAGDNSNRFNDLWKYENHKWTLIATDGQDQDDIPQERGGHQCCVYENRFIVIFGGIHEITYELNDLHIFDIKNGKWFLCNENNQNASQSGSPKNKAIMQQSDAFKKNQVQLNLSSNARYSNPMNRTNGRESPMNSTFQKSPQNKDSMNQSMRGKSLFQAHMNPLADQTMIETSKIQMKSPPKPLQIQTTTLHKKETKDSHVELLTPTSITMKNAFIIKNADQSFDSYFQMMKKRKNFGNHTTMNSPIKTGKKFSLNNSMQSGHNTGSHHHQNNNMNYSAFINSGHREDPVPSVKITDEKQPAGRDGHSAWLQGDKWIIFGGDRHHMPYNDTYVLDLGKLINIPN